MTLPANIVQRIEEFIEQHKTGQIALNFANGELRNADVREHVKPIYENCLDKQPISDTV